MVRFTATVRLRGPNPFVDVLTAAAAELLPLAEHGRIRVTGTLRGTEFNATVTPVRSGRHVLYLSGGLRTATGVRVGETVTVDVQALNANEVIPPGDLAAALDAAVGASDSWGQLPVSHRRELTRFLEDARTPSTRARRVEQLVALVQGQDVRPPGLRTGGALWTCPSCGRQFVTRNMNHSCSQHTLDEPFRDRPESIHRLFEVVCRTVEAIGPVTLVPYRDRVAFMVRVRFAGVKPANKWLDVEFWLTRRVESPRFRRVEMLSPYTHLYTVRVTEPSDVAGELAAWLREAYALGCQDHLRSPTA
ncbi:YdeI/OmpD-associated family protein [Pseudarthrobacter sp. HLT3-5]|uniref:YdeI/OmpD-associated family protein n=1 Tax=Pseudarthrobacter cellobiosi TaxID=2953654 RepID=UPI00208F7760|nr:YdeI/OmpD-associated family protein [Pseudarthrobacter sp. HLT3-5]MCO4275254.1 YdeI/OmpD-associated family protein [Pseudarthrobacter sp. HLT3-5]